VSDEGTGARAASGEASTDRPGAGESAADDAYGGVNVGAWPTGQPGQPGAAELADTGGQRPELAVAAAFGGGVLAAILLRRLASGD
jgi:hypothetical protein